MRIFDGRGVLEATHARIADDRIDAVGDASVQGADDVLVDGRGGTLLPGLIDAHVHLLPGCTQLAAVFGVTTLIDQFSKPEVIEPERAAVGAAARGSGPVRADLCTSSVGATAPGGHPTMAYEPLPYVTGPADAASFVEARLEEGATHLKVVLDDGSGSLLDIPTLDAATIEALVRRAHEHGLPVVAHASTSAGAVTVARYGVDVLAHAPFEHERRPGHCGGQRGLRADRHAERGRRLPRPRRRHAAAGCTSGLMGTPTQRGRGAAREYGIGVCSHVAGAAGGCGAVLIRQRCGAGPRVRSPICLTGPASSAEGAR
ncbi:hypothetical protein BJY14_007677 [Actinomadura luteofluorescens]|uniref:Amidohydrolase family protein n=1 Tax=Actinomadura luteofluorescens TaxID=46163 RepID=A0A7Y9EQ29_9ACTN|nr:hypothetical protein [Actinomadura luteofluorescens]NYD51694.1 hypothetical protein [Actinomadura luteofluorescens]